MNTLLKRIQNANKERLAIQNYLKAISEYYDLSYEEMYHYYHAMKPKQAEKFIEGWVAHLYGGTKINNKQVPAEYKKNDVGDIQGSPNLVLGENNIELKTSFNHNKASVGGGQFRLYEPVPYYLLFRSWSDTDYEMFLLTKEQLVHEIKQRAIDSGMSAYTQSQGSGDIRNLTNEEKFARLDENVNGTRDDKIGWDFNRDTEPEYYKHFCDNYRVTAEDLRKKFGNEEVAS